MTTSDRSTTPTPETPAGRMMMIPIGADPDLDKVIREVRIAVSIEPDALTGEDRWSLGRALVWLQQVTNNHGIGT